MKRSVVAMFSGLGVLLAIVGSWVFWQKPAGVALPLEVYFTCDIRGRLVPCGCFSGQMGGLTRIATILGEGKKSDQLKLDVGDAIEGHEDYHQIEYRFLLEAVAKLGYDAVNLGHREAALSAVQLRQFRASSPVPLLSANLLDQETGAALFPTHCIVRRGAWRIALVGVMDSRIPVEALGAGLSVEPMDMTLARLLPGLKKEADFIILLAFADEAKLAELARKFYELDLILGGKVSQPAQHLVRENRSLVFYTTNQSRAIGRLKLTLDEPSNLTARSGDILLMHDRIAQSKSVEELADAYREEIRRTHLKIDDPAWLQADRVPGLKDMGSFAGSERCLAYHANAARVWAGSSHAHAFKTLVDLKADADPNCIGCHSVGFGAQNGYRRDLGSSRLTNVGCESCHGPGGQHVAQRTAGSELMTKMRTVGAGDCQKCHHGEFSRPFVWGKFWHQIAHGK